MPATAIVPFRGPGDGKSRLARALTRDERATLATAMLRDVLAALTDAGIDRLVLAAHDDGAASAGRALGVAIHRDAAARIGLADAIDDAIAATAPRGDVLVVAADLPRLTGSEILALLSTDADVTVAPTHDGGTGGLLLRDGVRPPTAYGPASARQHVRDARARGLRTRLLPLAGFAADVDTAADLAALPCAPVGSHTRAALGALDRAPADGRSWPLVSPAPGPRRDDGDADAPPARTRTRPEAARWRARPPAAR